MRFCYNSEFFMQFVNFSENFLQHFWLKSFRCWTKSFRKIVFYFVVLRIRWSESALKFFEGVTSQKPNMWGPYAACWCHEITSPLNNFTGWITSLTYMYNRIIKVWKFIVWCLDTHIYLWWNNDFFGKQLDKVFIRSKWRYMFFFLIIEFLN